jgi:hypothetical protein
MQYLRVAGLILTAAALSVPVTAGAVTAQSFRGSSSGTFTMTPTAEPGVVLTQAVHTGRATRVGKYTLHARELTNLATLEVKDGSWTIITRNGTVFGTFAGQARALSPTELAYQVAGPINGGTGRWEGATGTIRVDGRADIAAGTLTEEISGLLKRSRKD